MVGVWTLAIVLLLSISASLTYVHLDSFGSLFVIRRDRYEEGVAAWKVYTDTLVHERLQEACVPRRYPFKGSYKGMVMLFHGYSACPDQWDTFAILLAAEGYDVLLPLLPGHGYQYTNVTGEVQDDYSRLPRTPEGYEDFGSSMANIAGIFPGSKRVGGVSVGGVMSAYVGMVAKNSDGVSVFDKQLVINPLFAAPDSLCGANGLVGLLTLIQKFKQLDWLYNRIANMQETWGEGCEEERRGGRGGICQFTIGDGHAALQFGRHTVTRAIDEAGTKPDGDTRPLPDIQVIYTDRDGTTSVDTTRKYYQALASADANPRAASVCAMEEYVGHSYLSPHDTPHANKFWLKEALCHMTTFMTSHAVSAHPNADSHFIPQNMSHTTTVDDGDEFCLQSCTASTCAWSQATAPFPPVDANDVCPSYVPDWAPAVEEATTTTEEVSGSSVLRRRAEETTDSGATSTLLLTTTTADVSPLMSRELLLSPLGVHGNEELTCFAECGCMKCWNSKSVFVAIECLEGCFSECF